ncbi:MAG: Rrf2 family transcriptional regulator [Ignavibacteriales bacterium]|nr:Rrf2 family transcriptional regulator [Ignavibacteriales bacterium]
MGLIFSRQCEYALQALLYLALKPNGQMTSIKELTKRLNIPYHFLAKILQDLAHKELLHSLKGPTGGFSLGMPAQDITLFHVVEAVDGIGFTNSCVLGFKECSERNPCAVHEKWGSIRESVYDMLVSKNIAQMAREMKKPEYKPPFE